MSIEHVVEPFPDCLGGQNLTGPVEHGTPTGSGHRPPTDSDATGQTPQTGRDTSDRGGKLDHRGADCSRGRRTLHPLGDSRPVGSRPATHIPGSPVAISLPLAEIMT